MSSCTVSSSFARNQSFLSNSENLTIEQNVKKNLVHYFPIPSSSTTNFTVDDKIIDSLIKILKREFRVC